LTFTDDDLITVNMGVPKHQPSEIPMLIEREALTYKVTVAGVEHVFSAVSMGNPHAVIRVDDVQNTPVADWGRALESHELFPERANIGFMQIIDRQHIKLRVYERGASETLACGSGACAAVVLGILQNCLGPKVSVELPGGQLAISWAGRGEPVLMTGSATSVFDGIINI